MPGVKVPVRAPVCAQRSSDPNHPKATRVRTRDLPALTSAEVALVPILRFLGSCNAVALPVSRSPCFFPSLALCVKCSDCFQGFYCCFVHSVFHLCHPLPFHISNITRGVLRVSKQALRGSYRYFGWPWSPGDSSGASPFPMTPTLFLD